MTTVAFIGAGNMAKAIIGGMLNGGFAGAQIIAADPNPDQLAEFAQQGVRTTSDNLAAIDAADIVVLAVKPQVMKQVCEPLAATAQAKQPLFVSIAAGLPANTIVNWLGGNLAMARVMPNTPAMVGKGVSGLWAPDSVTEAQRQTLTDIFAGTGLVQWVANEATLHDITAVSGSGPAYFYLFIQAMAEKAQAYGFSEQEAKILAAQTALGAAEMVLQSDDSPAQLKQNVMSPGGTTERAIATFENQGLPQLVADAMDACKARSETLAKALSD